MVFFPPYRRLGNIESVTADLLANGAVVGWFQGRSEIGPRALGNRSILADPMPATNKQRINSIVKKREAHRPFAPSVLAERFRDYFIAPEQALDFPFMVFVLEVRPEVRDLLGAVTHVDGTARVQTVARDVNPRFYDLIAEFGKRTGVYLLLNTSFNNDAEPIVDSFDDAIACYLTTGLDYLVIGDFLIQKRPIDDPERYQSLIPVLPQSRKLVKYAPAYPHQDNSRFAIESILGSYFAPESVTISDDPFRLLSTRSHYATLGERFREAGLEDPTARAAVAAEMARLWQQRAIILRVR